MKATFFGFPSAVFNVYPFTGIDSFDGNTRNVRLKPSKLKKNGRRTLILN